MSYIKINGDDVHYNVSISPFTTQHGYSAIRFIGEDIPETDKGFKLYNDKDEVISDFSDYKYIYRQNEYSTEHDEIVYPKGSDAPLSPSAYDNLSRRISRVANAVSVTANGLAETNDALCEYTTDIDNRVGELEDSFCEYTTDNDIRVGEVEDSLCELSEDEESE